MKDTSCKVKTEKTDPRQYQMKDTSCKVKTV